MKIVNVKTAIHSFCLAGVALWTLFSSIAFADVNASVNTQQIMQGESITLTLTSTSSSGDPDLSPLDALFDVRYRGKQSDTRIINGVRSSNVHWFYQLTPKVYSSTIVIPSITIGKESTQEITLQTVAAPPLDVTLRPEQQVSVHLNVPSESIYVQQNVPLELEILVNASIAPRIIDLQLDPESLQNMPFQIVNERPRQSYVDKGGQHYISIHYPIRFSSPYSGTVTIDPITVNVYVKMNNRELLYPFSSKTTEITVLPKPADYPSQMPFLPARQITLSETWSDRTQLKEGDAITRTLTLQAVGLSSQQLLLPNFEGDDSIKMYPETIKREPSKTNAQGDILGEISLKIVMVPTASGEVTVPEISIPWWNTDKDQLEYATLESSKFYVAPNPDLINTVQTVETAPEIATTPTSSEISLFWKVFIAFLIAFLLLLMALIAVLYYRLRRLNPQQMQKESSKKALHQDHYLKKLKTACLAQESLQVKSNLDRYLKQRQIAINDWYAASPDFKEQYDKLNHHLYADGTALWDGAALWHAIESLIHSSHDSDLKQGKNHIPPLYPH